VESGSALLDAAVTVGLIIGELQQLPLSSVSTLAPERWSLWVETKAGVAVFSCVASFKLLALFRFSS
jgi:hypothetical protein